MAGSRRRTPLPVGRERHQLVSGLTAALRARIQPVVDRYQPALPPVKPPDDVADLWGRAAQPPQFRHDQAGRLPRRESPQGALHSRALRPHVADLLEVPDDILQNQATQTAGRIDRAELIAELLPIHPFALTDAHVADRSGAAVPTCARRRR